MKTKIFDVFTEGPSSGNPTAVIYWKGEIDRMKMRTIAEKLNLPDSIFIFDVSHTNTHIFNSLTFSPYEELSVCAQGMIGAFNAVQEDLDLAKGSYTIGTAAGPKKLIWDKTLAYVSMGKPELTAHEYLDTLRDVITPHIKENAVLQIGVVDLSRKRLLIEVAEDYISYINISAPLVMDVCSRLALNGITFFTRVNANEVRSRHFTTSLNGYEDAVTGGASAAILAFINHGAQNQHELRVHQGGFNTRSGTMFVYHNISENEIYVGGRCQKTSAGDLLIDNSVTVHSNPYIKLFQNA